MQTGEWEYDNIKFEGLSLAGIRTSLTIPEFSIAFDVAQGLPFVLGMKHFFISHGHLDHAAGIPYIISQKAMNNHPAPNFYMPESLVEPMTEIMRLWEKIEDHQYKFKFVGLKSTDLIEIKPNIVVRPFKTVHRVPSYGYSIFRKVKKLKNEYSHLNQHQIVDLRRDGINPNDHFEDRIVSFTGDTQIEFLDLNPEVLNSKILILEATYLDDRKSISSAKEWGHTHLDEIIERIDKIKSEKIVIIHTSSRYSFKEAHTLIQSKIPAQHRERVILYPGR